MGGGQKDASRAGSTGSGNRSNANSRTTPLSSSSSSSSAPRMSLSQRIPRKKSASEAVSMPKSSTSAVPTVAANKSSSNAAPRSSSSSTASSASTKPIKPTAAQHQHQQHASTTSATATTTTIIKHKAPAPTAATSTPAPAPARKVVRRPPLKVYLKIAIIRKDDDVVVCEDPEHPGRKKEIVVMSKLMMMDGGHGNKKRQAESKEEKCGSTSVRQQQQPQLGQSNANYSNNDKTKQTCDKSSSSADQNNDKVNVESANKKEIPVPTITTVKRYDTDVPPNYEIPPSYVRNVCPTFDEVMDGAHAIEYNADGEDEKWWRTNGDFGPYSKARIVVMKGEQVKVDADADAEEAADYLASTSKNQEDGHGKKNHVIEKEGISVKPSSKKNNRNRQGKFVKKGSSKKGGIENDDDDYVHEAKDREDAYADGDEMDETKSDISAEYPSPSSHNYTTIEQVLLQNPKYLHSRHSTRYLLRKYNPKLPLKSFERMMDILEKATGFESIVTNQQAQDVLGRKMPELEDIFGPMSDEERRMEEEYEERHSRRWLKNSTNDGGGGGVECTTSSSTLPTISSTATTCQQQEQNENEPLPTLAQPITLPAVIAQVYQYWVAKRSKLKKPLLRRYWPPTAMTDTNPHQVFRRQDKEKRRLRKKKQNDTEAYKKMKQLKLDFERVGMLCELIRKREQVNETLVELTNDYFEERLHGFVDTSGAPRHGSMMTKRKVEGVLNDVPKYFDDGPIIKVKGGKKRKRSSQVGWNVGDKSCEPSPVPPRPALALASHGALPPPKNPSSASMAPPLPTHGIMKPPPISMATMPPPRNVVVAGHDGGLPAPNFLQPLASRESHTVTTWEDAVPHMPSYVNGVCTTRSDKFRHRPRLGRGGRIVVDRVPCPSTTFSQSENVPYPPTVITYGSPMPRSGYDISALGADGPNYSINSSPDKCGPKCSPVKRGGQVMAISEGAGTDSKSAPKAPPAQSLVELLPKSLGNPTLISRRIEEICALGLMEDNNESASTAAAAASTLSLATSKSGPASMAAVLGDEIDEVLVPIEDWMEAPEGLRVYGSEKFVIGPL